MQSVIIAKLKKTNERTEICEYKIDTSIIGKLMPIRMFKVLYLNSKITYLKIILYAYNNPCILQMGVYKVNIINKCINYLCSFFLVPGNRPALLGMSDCK